MTGYRIASAVQAGCYLALAESIWDRPSQALPGQTTVFDLVARSGLWALMFAVAALLMLIGCVTRPQWIHLGHTFLFVVVLSFGVASLGTSVLNSTGWSTAALCGALAAGHVIAIRRRPLLPPEAPGVHSRQ